MLTARNELPITAGIMETMSSDARSSVEAYVDGTTVVFIPRSDLTEEHLKQYLTCCEQVIAKAGYYTSLIDISQLGVISSGVRKRAVEWARRQPVISSQIALFGGNAVRKTLVMLLLRAVQILAGKALNVRFFGTEAEARAWLAADSERAQKMSADRP